MKKLAALSLCLLAVVFTALAQTVETPTWHSDEHFFKLINWAKEISGHARTWNDHCADKLETGCSEYQALLEKSMKDFIADALTYTVEVNDSDCTTRLRMETVAHEIRMMRWDLACAGKVRDVGTCAEESAAIDEEIKILSANVKVCLGITKSL